MNPMSTRHYSTTSTAGPPESMALPGRKQVIYDAVTRDECCQFDGQLIGYTTSHAAEEAVLNAFTHDLLVAGLLESVPAIPPAPPARAASDDWQLTRLSRTMLRLEHSALEYQLILTTTQLAALRTPLDRCVVGTHSPARTPYDVFHATPETPIPTTRAGARTIPSAPALRAGFSGPTSIVACIATRLSDARGSHWRFIQQAFRIADQTSKGMGVPAELRKQQLCLLPIDGMAHGSLILGQPASGQLHPDFYGSVRIQQQRADMLEIPLDGLDQRKQKRATRDMDPFFDSMDIRGIDSHLVPQHRLGERMCLPQHPQIGPKSMHPHGSDPLIARLLPILLSAFVRPVLAPWVDSLRWWLHRAQPSGIAEQPLPFLWVGLDLGQQLVPVSQMGLLMTALGCTCQCILSCRLFG